MDLREERFRGLYDTGRSRVAAYVLRRTTNHEDAADVVAETFAIAWRRLEDIPGGVREVPWLLAVARKVIANRLRGTTSQNTVVERLARKLVLSTSGEGRSGSWTTRGACRGQSPLRRRSRDLDARGMGRSQLRGVGLGPFVQSHGSPHPTSSSTSPLGRRVG